MYQQPEYSYAYHYPVGYVATPEVRSKTLGIWALVAAVAALVLSVAASIVTGVGLAMSEEAILGSSAYDQGMRLVLISLFSQFLWTLFGIAGLVLGIIAVSTRRGRPQGVVAIIVAVLAPVISFIVYTIATVSAFM